MPGYLLVQPAQVKCAHGAPAQPTLPLPRVKVQGMALVSVDSRYPVLGCPMKPPASPPCVLGQFLPPTATLRVKVMGQAVLLESSQGTCSPTSTPLLIVPMQQRVKAQ